MNLKFISKLYNLNIKAIAAFCLLAFLYIPEKISFAQYSSYDFRRYTVEEGLSNNTVHAIVKDPTGLMWFATEDGLDCYDGYSTKIYRTSDEKGAISDNYIRSLLVDKQGRLWIGTSNGGLNLYDKNNDNFIIFQNSPHDNTSLPDNDILSIFEDSDGDFWVGTRNGGLSNFDRKTGKCRRYLHNDGDPFSISGHGVSVIYQDKSGTLWIGTTDGGLDKFDKKTGRAKCYTFNQADPASIGDNVVLAVYEDSEGMLWVGTQDGGLNRLDRKSGKFSRYLNSPYDPHSIGYNTVSSVFEDKEGTFWVATINGGLEKFNRKTGKFTRILSQPSNMRSLTSNLILCTYIDNDGLIWLGTSGGGVNLYDCRKTKFSRMQHIEDNKNSLSYNIIRSIMLDRSGLLWIGTLGGGLNIYDKKTDSFSLIKKEPGNKTGLRNNGVTSLFEDSDGDIWIGTWAGGLHKLIKGSRNRFEFFLPKQNDNESISSDIIQSVFEDRLKRIWVGTEYGLNVLNKKTGRFVRFLCDPDNKNSISDNRLQSGCIIQDHWGNLWVGTWNGLNMIPASCMQSTKYSDYRFTHFQRDRNSGMSIGDNRVISLHEDSQGRIWAGTYSGGLNMVIWEKGKEGVQVKGFRHYGTNDGLPNNTIFSILDDNEGNLWVSTNYKLAKFSPETGVFINYDEMDGLQGNQFYWGAGYKSRDGMLYFGGIYGLTFFYPVSITARMQPAPVIITRINKFGKPVHLGKPAYDVSEITLTNKENFISFEFVCLDYSNPEKIEYKYKLENFDKDWVYCGKRRYISFTNLEPGEYILKIRATNSDGIWNSNVKTLKIVVKPPYWATWWFRIAAVLSFLLIGYFLYKWRVNNLTRHSEELSVLNEKLVDEINERTKIEEQLVIAKNKAEESDKLKSEFLAQMSHEIRTPLNSIMSFSSLLREELQAKVVAEYRSIFDIIANSGLRMIRTVEMILNMSEIQAGSYNYYEKKLDVDAIIRRIIPTYENQACEKKLKFSYLKKTENTSILSDEHTVVTIFSQLIDNAVKYTHTGEIKIVLSRNEENRLSFMIKDTGIGISDEYLARIFQPFTQEEQGYTRRFEGNGLGLALVKKYCDLDRAEIKIDTRKNEGTCFTIVFP